MRYCSHVSLIPPTKLCSSWKGRLTWLVTSAAYSKAVEKIIDTSQRYSMAEGWVAPDSGEIPARQRLSPWGCSDKAQVPRGTVEPPSLRVSNTTAQSPKKPDTTEAAMRSLDRDTPFNRWDLQAFFRMLLYNLTYPTWKKKGNTLLLK